MSSTGSAASRPKKYICDFPLCEKAYNRPSLLQQHQRSHSQDRPFLCEYPDCDKSFLRNSHLQAHLLSHKASDLKPFKCSTCGKGVNTKQHLKRHEITHTKSFVCVVAGCTEAFHKHQQLRHHVLSVHEKTLTCKVCGKAFSRPNRLAQHQQKYHSEAPAYQCDYLGCFQNFKNWSALQLHVRTSHPKIICKVCGKGCVGKSGLKSHMIIHDESKILKLWDCIYCSENFNKKVDLLKHYHAFHDGNAPDDLLKQNEKDQLDVLLGENDSNLSFLAEVANTQNGEDISSDEETVSSGERERVSIITSNRKSESVASLESALTSSSVIDLIAGNVSHRKLPCPRKKCGRFFAREYDLKRHLEWHEKQLLKVEDFLSTLDKRKASEERTKSNMAASIDAKDIPAYGTVESSESAYDSEEELNRMIDDELIKV